MIGGYVEPEETGELAERAELAKETLKRCELCPRKCRVDRTAGELGTCGIGAEAVVSGHGPHFGEESVLVGCGGSGTVFLTGCNLACVFCQNYDISHLRRGSAVTTVRLGGMMAELQDIGCHNVNWVSPTHQVPQLLEALHVAAGIGLRVPIVYNCGGYESLETLKLLDGVVDIYMPDIKYGANEPGKLYSGVPDYWNRCREAIREMRRQVGDLVTEEVERGGRTCRVAAKGVLVRHLVIPNDLAKSSEVARFLAQEVSRNTFVNVMAQYRPQYRASDYLELSRSITSAEYRAAVESFRREGIHRFSD